MNLQAITKFNPLFILLRNRSLFANPVSIPLSLYSLTSPHVSFPFLLLDCCYFPLSRRLYRTLNLISFETSRSAFFDLSLSSTQFRAPVPSCTLTPNLRSQIETAQNGEWQLKQALSLSLRTQTFSRVIDSGGEDDTLSSILKDVTIFDTTSSGDQSDLVRNFGWGQPKVAKRSPSSPLSFPHFSESLSSPARLYSTTIQTLALHQSTEIPISSPLSPHHFLAPSSLILSDSPSISQTYTDQ